MSLNRPFHVCIINLGHYRSGTTTLAKAADTLGLKVSREFPHLSPETLRRILVEPAEVVREWWHCHGGREETRSLLKKYSLVCDGWIALLAFLSPEELLKLQQEMRDEDVVVHFVATTRDVNAIVRSELQNWVVHDLERKCDLTTDDRSCLEQLLRSRAFEHARRINGLECSTISIYRMPLEQCDQWSSILSNVMGSKSNWQDAFDKAGVQNANPPLPIQGILLTLRIGVGREAEQRFRDMCRLLEGIEADSLCRYLVVLAIDTDEADGPGAATLKTLIASRRRIESLHVVVNPLRTAGEPFGICHSWDQMAKIAWENGADWVTLLGDDIEIDTTFHYRSFYRAFLDISERLQVPFGFGCPWWNDSSFPGFPTFPVVGKAHFDIFGGLIPKHRYKDFVNQDLDPYLQRLYLKFGAAPLVTEARLTNRLGGNDVSPARYKRVPAIGWRDWVLEDVTHIHRYLEISSSLAEIPSLLLIDVVVPSYRVDVPFLERICSLNVPENLRTTFIIVIDNPHELMRAAIKLASLAMDSNHAALVLERHLVESSKSAHNDNRGNNVRVRCNAQNLGAPASRNRGLDESSAEYVLFLDDDVVPDPKLLYSYGQALENHAGDDIVGLVGLVRFPRSPILPLKHAAVLMSYLTFMFEIADNPHYTQPAWGVTANILVTRLQTRFDTAYCKTGGGEDVDFCLRLAENAGGGRLLACPSAIVHHPFWPGSPLSLSKHFFNWATGDSALFTRFPEHCYRSWPNAVETLLILIPVQLFTGSSVVVIVLTVLLFVIADILVEMADGANYRNRCSLLQYERTAWFYIAAHVLADMYVLILETGRLYGHLKRREFQHVTRRFDWHCKRLEHSERNFRRRERDKFVCFCSIAVAAFAVQKCNNKYDRNLLDGMVE